jgi:hypothetical protein
VPHPAKRTNELVDEIVRRVSDGETLTSACKAHDITTQAFRNWLHEDEELALRFARARALGFDAIAEKLMETTRGSGDSSGDVARDKLIVETDLKLLAKWDPKRYGERMQHTGEGGGPIQVNFYIPSNGRD